MTLETWVLVAVAMGPGMLALAGVWYSSSRSGLAHTLASQTEELRRLQESHEARGRRIELLENTLAECKAEIAEQVKTLSESFERRMVALYARIEELENTQRKGTG